MFPYRIFALLTAILPPATIVMLLHGWNIFTMQQIISAGLTGCFLLVLAAGLWWRNQLAGVAFVILAAAFGVWGVYNTVHFPRPMYSLVLGLVFSLLFFIPLFLAWSSRLRPGDLASLMVLFARARERSVCAK